MIVALGDGKIEIVQERMKNYKLTKKQKETLDKLITEKEITEIIEEEKKKITPLTDIMNTLGDTILEYNDLK